MAWSLLQKLVLDNENSSASVIKKSVVKKLLHLNSFVPQWLLNEYKVSSRRPNAEKLQFYDGIFCL